MRWLKIAGVVALVLVVSALAAGSYLLGTDDVPEKSNYVIDFPALRRIAAAEAGPLPVAVHSEIVMRAAMPRAMIMAGESFDGTAMVHTVFQLRFPDGRFILIDSGIDAAGAAAMPEITAAVFDAAAAAKVEAALERAWQIVITHEHGDHIGGIAKHPRPEKLAAGLRLSAEQLASEKWLAAVDFPEVLRQLEPLRYETAVAIAPGVVLQKAPGHTPGSQIVFVRLADQREFLFVGDVAWNRDALVELKYRPRFVTDLMLGENREQVLAQFRALHEVMERGEVQVIVSHDPRDREEYGLAEPFPDSTF